MTITVNDLDLLLRPMITEFAGVTDPRARAKQPPRYLHAGEPGCLVAVILARAGISTGVLKELDRELAERRSPNAGIQFRNTKHPVLRRFDPTAVALLHYLQVQNDRAYCWDYAIQSAAARPAYMHPMVLRRTKPWLS